MENKSNSRTKKPQENSLSFEASSEGPLSSGPQISHVKKSEKSYLEGSLEDGSQYLLLPETDCNKNAIELLSLKTNNINGLRPEDQKKIEKLSHSFWRQLEKSTPAFTNKAPSLKLKSLRKNTIDLLHSKLYSWDTLLNNLVSMPSLKGFSICQVLCHEKGTTNVVSYSFGSDGVFTDSKTSIESFNKVFSQIKKSKSRQFSQTNLSIPEFNFVGSFLASIYQLKTHNILFLLSDNSFFPVSEEVIDEVGHITPQISSVLEVVINKDLSDNKISNLFRVFEILPSPISIINQHGVPVYQNSSFKDSSALSDSVDSANIFESELSGGFKLVMLIDSNLSKSEIQHFQRVELLGELLNTLQHELSNPLFGIQLATELLDQLPSNASVKESLGDISENCKRCQDILRDFKFIYQGGDSFLDISLEKIIRETLTLTKSASRGIKKGVIIEDALKSNLILTNPTWLSQILFNLIINSSQAILSHSESQGVGGEIEIKVLINVNNLLEIKVSDNGPGIEQAIRGSIFEPFYTTKQKGTGLGLSICQSLAEKLGGKMQYNSSPGAGASFSLLIPFNEIHNR